MEKKMENEMETGIILGLYRDNGKQNGNYYSILGLYRVPHLSQGTDGSHVKRPRTGLKSRISPTPADGATPLIASCIPSIMLFTTN